jgi:hypothetical protein
MHDRSSMPDKILCSALREMWGEEIPRSRTLARLARHERHIEHWWKCEMAAHLWDYAERFGEDVCVWLEAFDRADLALATGEYRNERLVPSAAADRFVVPIELEMVGTFDGAGSGIEKAYREPGKKRLEQDMLDARSARREANPFAAVALLVTHAGEPDDFVIQDDLRRARELGDEYGLSRVLTESIPLPVLSDAPSAAHQLVWLASPPGGASLGS